MNIIQVIILGIIQGATELLPISSSAHLNVLPWIFNWTNSEEFIKAFEGFDVALHIGTLLAICIFFFKDWILLIKGGYEIVIKKKKSYEGKMFWYIVLSTIPAAFMGLILELTVGDMLDNMFIVTALALIIMGVLLYIADEKSKSEINLKQMTLKQSFLIGMSQSLALIPGFSRSGITITTARFLKIERKSAAKYSFLLSTPIVFAATILKFKDFVFSFNFFIGVFVSFIVGILSIKLLLKYLQNGNYKLFAIYRIIFGLIIILIFFIK